MHSIDIKIQIFRALYINLYFYKFNTYWDSLMIQMVKRIVSIALIISLLNYKISNCKKENKK